MKHYIFSLYHDSFFKEWNETARALPTYINFIAILSAPLCGFQRQPIVKNFSYFIETTKVSK